MEVLGIEIIWDGRGPYAKFRHEEICLAVSERSKLPKSLGSRPGYPEGLNGGFEFAVNVDSKEKADGLFERVTGDYAPRPVRSAMLADPEDNLIEMHRIFGNEHELLH